MLEPGRIRVRLTGEGRADCLEWASRPGLSVALLISGDREPESWQEFAALTAQDWRVIAAPPATSNTAGLVSALGGTPLLVAHGTACAAAILVASGVAQVSGLVLADCGPDFEGAKGQLANVPVMLLRGRQSRSVSHAQAVALHEAMPGSRLIEPEDCGDWPFGSCPEAAATAVRWFASQSGAPFLELETARGKAAHASQ
jgi:pimeloyl-ACP methyl ester carboxylesterase